MARALARGMDPKFSQTLSDCCRTFCAPISAASTAPNAPKGPKWRNELRYRVRKSLAVEGESDSHSLHAAVILERYPICFPDLVSWKSDYLAWKEKWNAWKYKVAEPGWLDCDKQVLAGSSQEASWVEESVITEADRENDVRSLRRKTQGFLYLAVLPHNAADGAWRLPTSEVDPCDKSLRDTANRALAANVGTSIETFVFGHAPAGHVEEDKRKQFLMLGVVLDGDVVLRPDARVRDFAWLTRSELLAAYDGYHDMQTAMRAVMVE